MSWDFDQCADYVKRNAPASTRPALLLPASRAYSPKFPNLFILYYSMPDWLAIFELGPRHVGSRKFESVAHQYRFVAQSYHGKVAKLLDGIAGFGSGTALLQEIAAAGRHSVRVLPHWHWKQANLAGPRNASVRSVRADEKLASAVNGTFPNTADAYAKGAPILDDNRRPTSEIGTGKGSDVVLFYSPEDWERKDSTDGPGFEPDEVLFHELVHATRDLRGFHTGLPVDGDFGNEEEYLATTLANLYLSEKGKPLRGTYDEPSERRRTREIKVGGRAIFRVIDPPPKGWAVMRDPDTWYDAPGPVSLSPDELMQRFSDTQKAFYLALSRLPDGKPPFNPVKEHAKRRAHGLALARQRQAIRQGTK
ncbi:MAG: hypothetical protein JNK31_02395 [Candidatus Competibacter sp.]|nr:hypothetical protein [Candidatus Competibacter sp.]